MNVKRGPQVTPYYRFETSLQSGAKLRLKAALSLGIASFIAMANTLLLPVSYEGDGWEKAQENWNREDLLIL